MLLLVRLQSSALGGSEFLLKIHTAHMHGEAFSEF